MLKNYDYADLFQPAGLKRLDDDFLCYLKTGASDLHEKLLQYRNNTCVFTQIETSELLISWARILETFLAELFNIEEALAMSKARTISYNPISAFKKYFVLRRAKKDLNKADNFPSFAELNDWINTELAKSPLQTEDKEMGIALLGTTYLEHPDKHEVEIEKLVQWCVRAMTSPEGKIIIHQWTSFKIPQRIDHNNLVPTISHACGRKSLDEVDLRLRDGFELTDPRMSAREVQDEINYCIYCHDHEGDFCSRGFPVKKGDPTQGFKKNPLNVTLTGCPLEEKISEMHFLKKDGATLASLAMVMVDNPMCPATGHRICNECMKACIYQKQDPVNIPQIETRVLTDVLDLPWGVEIYDLLTRWNPLRAKQWVMKPYNGLKVMIAGMGPAGFTLAHHLLLEGFAVVGFDGLKIEPLPESLIKNPIYKFDDLRESLDERLMAGFGGVAEYGITVRWDKNFLKLIYLSLLRRPTFQVFGGVRFGGTITIDDAWQMGFDHFVLAVGAGLPKALSIPGSLAPGMRQANDFLMALQLGSAAKASSLTNLQVRMPAVVIGGGLTGVDTATELQAYYIAQIEKILDRYEILCMQMPIQEIEERLDPASREILKEYIAHAKAVRNERARAKELNEQPNFIKLIQSWGGVTIVYRKTMQESPAYINNHEELKKALEEGIYYLENLEPKAVDLDLHGHCEKLICVKRENSTEEYTLNARSILVATGTQPNTAYEFEHRGTFNRLNLQYQHYEDIEGELQVAHGVEHCKDPDFGPFTSYNKHDKRISLIGDTHPVFHGSVVRAIASGLQTYPKILVALKNKLLQPGDISEYQQFAAKMRDCFQSRITKKTRIADDIVEVTIKSPLAAKRFKSGEFYRIQNYETRALEIDKTLLQMEPLALVAAECDPHHGELTFIIRETSHAAKICASLKIDEPISLMGPTGVRAKIAAEHETVLIIGNESSFPFVRSYGPELIAAGNKVIYCGTFNSAQDVHGIHKLEKATSTILWLTKNGKVNSTRPGDFAINSSDTIETLIEYANQIELLNVDRVYVIGDTNLLRSFQAARNTSLKEYLVKDPKVYGAVYGNMQCMLKGVCAQCLQWQIDPETGQRTKAVFACSWQDQPLEIIDIDHIDARSQQNRLHEHINKLWVDYLFAKHSLAEAKQVDLDTQHHL